ncbi:CD83 antigen [Notolabrus celidotus]|uniref:CD83 antigen n=1 Tax=Notolabrus celidotus TaxID=1203425 RepID=UPI00148FB9C4|nr:CD83 antigen [Notolabrus celidotus]
MMSLDFLNAALLMSLCVWLTVGMVVPEDTLEVKTFQGEDCTLPCPAVFKEGVEYLSLTWYKAIQPPSKRLSGILTRGLPNGTVQWYLGVEREVELLGDSPAIFIPNITCADRGVYTCQLAAPLGEQNREKEVILTVSDCPAESTDDLAKDASLVVIAVVLLLVALLTFRISYVCLRNILRDKKQETPRKETLLDGRLRPLDKKDLMMISTLGPKPSKTMKHGGV